MPKCNNALQTEKDIFHTEIRPTLYENCYISTLVTTCLVLYSGPF